MSEQIALVILMPFLVYMLFQPPLQQNASMVEETINVAIYEAQKQASIEGRYSEEIYKKFKDFLMKNHNFDPDKIKITGTETLTPRGEELTVTVSAPKPLLDVMDAFKTERDPNFEVTRKIVSEYTP